MVKKEDSYFIDYPPEKVFGYMSQPENAAEVSPTVDSSEGIAKADNGGWIVEAEYTVAGGIADGVLELRPEIYEENSRIRYVLDDDIAGYIDWKFNESVGGTEFVYETEYTVEIPVPDIFMKTVGRNLTKKELDSVVENIRQGVSEYAAD